VVTVIESDEEYVRLCRDGKPEIFRHLVCRHEAALIAFLSGRLDRREEVIEVAQDVMVRAYFALPKLKNPAAFSSWLLGIADHAAKESRRKTSRGSQPAESADLDRIPSRPEADPDAHRSLARAVAGLPDTHRQIILLRFYGSHSCAEIGRMLGVPVGTVTSRLSRAYTLLRDALREHD
jgi:RNA polymerase sigma-70 factor (ECF subfamily)